jgi:signal transduction histidine kinase
MNHVPVLVAASTIAMLGLIYFQYKWISNSRELYNEVFHQRACMALCSTLEEYGEGAICNNFACSVLCGDGEEVLEPEHTDHAAIVENENFQYDLRRTLNFYNIDLTYQLSQSDTQPIASNQAKEPTCVVNIPGHAENEASYIALEFPDQQALMLGKLKYMIGASVMILFFTACVLLVANWWLLKQKRLLKTNVEIYNNMAHEFRTPLTNIQLASSLLLKDSKDAKSNKFLDIISKENSRLIGQVERVLHLARLDTGDYALQNERLDLLSLLESVKEEINIQIEEKQATVDIRVPSQTEIFGDKQHLSNVFRNLLDNALKYSTVKPVITVVSKEEKNGIIISVADNGVGIPASQTEFIFEKFQRIQDGNLHTQKGFGLGLAYVKKIVELHKGSVDVNSEINKGSCFTIFLPKLC